LTQWLNHKRYRLYIYQGVAVSILMALLVWLGHNTWVNLKDRGIQSGFDFLADTAGFDIGETFLVSFDGGQSYWRALLVGVFNTLRVSACGLVAATLLGFGVGLGRCAGHPLIRFMSGAYIELIRNIPLMIQLLMWYVLWVEYLPSSTEPYGWFHLFYLSQEGFAYPGLLLLQSIDPHGVSHSQWIWSLPVWDDQGVHAEFNLSPEFLSLTFALTLYTSAFIAEIVRAGIQSVPKGQVEAGQSLALTPWQIMRFVVLPQAARMMAPPLTNQYLNLVKNSSLAVVVGYPDVVNIANTALNQTGRALECISILMLVYLTLSLAIAWGMNQTNTRARQYLTREASTPSGMPPSRP
jgi:general L-amino acid transport system permease protein